MSPFYVTTSIAYPNANPHIGYALELAQADFFARYSRLRGSSVYFLTGLDEHGIKIQKKAEEAGITPQAFVDTKAAVFKELAERLNLSNDRFIRTSDADHEKVSQTLWKLCLDNGDIYKKQYRAWYDVKEEEFLGTVEEFEDPSQFNVDPRFIELIDEENYFFRLSRYEDKIRKLLIGGEYKVYPPSRMQEIINLTEKTGWQDVSVSRAKSKLSWGISVPNDDSQVMYVWFDALVNYLTATCTIDDRGKLQAGRFWPPSLHCVGKDIHRFHLLIWTGMLLSAGFKLPKELLVHGFLTAGGRKMSKSLGNGVDPLPLLQQWGADSVRWYLLKEVPTTGDADFTEERLGQVFTADLANDYGNLVSRVWTMCQKYTAGTVPQVTAEQVDNLERVLTEEKWREYHEAVAARRIHEAMRAAHALMVFCNRRIEEQKPWVIAKDASRADELYELLYELLEIVRHISLMLKPALPATADKVARIFPSLTAEQWQSYEVGSQWGLLKPGTPLGAEQPILFPRSA